MLVRPCTSGWLLSLLAASTLAVAGCGQSGDKHGEAKDPAGSEKARSSASADSKKPHDHSNWWCEEHGVPEAECSMCDAKVAAACKKRGDWCDRHDRAMSQCFICTPKQKEKYAAIYRAKEGKEPPTPEENLPSKEPNNKGPKE